MLPRFLRPLFLAGLCLFAHAGARAEKVALFINFGDTGALDKEMKASADSAAKIFPKLGYKFILISPNRNIRQTIAGTFETIADGRPEDLIVITHGHGEIVLPLSDSRRFPSLRTRTGPYGNHSLSFVFMNGRHPEGNALTGSANWQAGHVGVGDFADWIYRFRAKNPRTPVRMIVAECYSGSAARLLNKIPGVKAFASASDHEKAHLHKDKKGVKRAFVDLYLEELAAKGPDADSFEVFESARNKWMDLTLNYDVRITEVPWSPLDARINSWCEEHEAVRSSGSASLDAALERFKKMTDQTIAHEAAAARSWRKREKCDVGQKVRLNREGFALAVDAWAKLVDATKARFAKLTFAEFRRAREEQASGFQHEPEFVALIGRVNSEAEFATFVHETRAKLDDSLNCYRTIQAVGCGAIIDPRPYSYLIGSYDWTDNKISRQCAYETDESIASCVKAVSGITETQIALAADKLRRIFARTIGTALDSCSDRRREYYQTCYDRFWREADLRALDDLLE